jgi:non-reducing end alpha-L-arabinofuranosidase
VQPSPRRLWSLLLGAVVVLLVGLDPLACPDTAQAAAPERPHAAVPARALAAALPCDIYASGGTPCVAAHSTTRALFATYNGPLYRVQRWSDSAQLVINTLGPGGYADSAAQDAFCEGDSCTITALYDQTRNHNNLSIEGPDGNGGQDAGANASALPVMAGGHKVYGLYVSSGVGYRDNVTTGVATGSQPEGMYMVTEGRHVNNRCCFDYGNVETNAVDNGNGHMDAVNFSSACWFHPCSGSGPWVQADLENGLFAGGNGSWPANAGRSTPFVTAILKNNGTSTYAIKDGDARSGGLTTRYSGPLPNIWGYAPMHREGAIVLGTGGDNSNGGVGSFFEGVMAAGYPTDATEDALQADIAAVGYSKITTFPVDGGTYTLTNVNSGKVAEPVNCGTVAGTLVVQWTPLGTPCQRWHFTSAASGTWMVTNVNSGKVLEAVNCGLANGTPVDLGDPIGNPCQQWAVVPAGGNRYELVVGNSGMVLDDTDCGTVDGTPIRLRQWRADTCQVWAIAP